ncbi:MAG TPA: hypothetical protein HA275_00800 [Halobacteriales archaeon]|uniref:hypothetical protein n=1 Tax=Candidatus Hikarchaeum yamanae TaxID=2675326 RepID=UPI0017D6841A|nr:hypothetical protein [Halobacteriales archaeon]|tara:strand:- start:148619 stop:149185 length:567 start_codon:yes stop_codon:yes gene_type:complete
MGDIKNIVLREIFESEFSQYPLSNYVGDFYMAVDGSFRGETSGLGVIIETYQGENVLKISQQGNFPDSNAAEYGALKIGLETLLGFVDQNCRIGIITDHDRLSANINTISRGRERMDFEDRISVPRTVKKDWKAIIKFADMCQQVRSVCIKSKENPAHRLANLVGGYTTYGNAENQRTEIPPPSRIVR